MDKQMLRCDICGGELEMQGGGKAVCTSCGMKYSTESLREKFNGLKVSVTGSRDDVAQWKELVNRYLEKHDFTAAEGVIKKILEAAPTDEFAITLYEKIQDWKFFEVVNGTLIRYHGYEKRVELPDGIRKIGKNAFGEYGGLKANEKHKATEIQGIIIPESVIEIEGDAQIHAGAFSGCKQLEKVVLPSNLQTIGAYAFDGCTNLQSIDLPDSLTSIGACAFGSCDNLQSIDLPNHLSSIGAYAFDGCTNLQSINLPNSLTSIGDGAFSYCTNLQSINLPNSLTSIGDGAFSYCTNLQSIDLPDSLTSIEGGAFSYCTNLQSIDLPDSLTLIGSGAFRGCHSLKAVVWPKSVRKVPGNCFEESGIKSIELPYGLEEIEQRAFAECPQLEEIVFPNGIKYIGDGAFNLCASLRRIVIPENTTLKVYAFRYCKNLETVEYEGRININADSPSSSPFYESAIYKIWEKKCRCLYCGGKIGMLSRVCSRCGKNAGR